MQIAKQHNAKRIILGCTHYPYLVDIFKKILNVEYFNPALSLAETIKKDIQIQNNKGSLRFCVSKNPEDFILSAKMFFDVKKAELIEV